MTVLQVADLRFGYAGDTLFEGVTFSLAIGERAALVGGLLCGVAGYLVYGFASQGWMLLAATPVLTLWGIASSALQAMMSRLVDSTAQGRLQGANSSMLGIGSLVAPTMFTQALAWGIASGTISGAPFLLGAGILGLAAVIALRVTRNL